MYLSYSSNLNYLGNMINILRLDDCLQVVFKNFRKVVLKEKVMIRRLSFQSRYFWNKISMPVFLNQMVLGLFG